jgi:hypothetical protein
MKAQVEAGDWVQAVEVVTEDLGGGRVLTHAEPGAVGHVLEVLPRGWINAYWERTGTITVCHESEFTVIHSAVQAQF